MSKIELHNEDCMDMMKRYPDNYFELAIVDPPYGIGLGFSDSHEQKRGGGKKGGHKQKDWNNEYPSIDYFKEVLRVSKKHIIWGANYYTEAIQMFGQGVIVHYKKPTPFIASTYSHADIAFTNCQNRITCFEHQWSGNVQNGRINFKGVNDYNIGLEQRIHPTQKPIALYKWLLSNYAKQGDNILDTHGGSMSIAIACHDLGFDLTLSELDKDYFEAGKKRLDNHRAQFSLFEPNELTMHHSK
jgi:site-specific DNA-methyltransferase (adenine-specific)